VLGVRRVLEVRRALEVLKVQVLKVRKVLREAGGDAAAAGSARRFSRGRTSSR
jgi:hypothetical protein